MIWYLDTLQNNLEWVREGDLGEGKVPDPAELAVSRYLLKLDDDYMDTEYTSLFLCMLGI